MSLHTLSWNPEWPLSVQESFPKRSSTEHIKTKDYEKIKNGHIGDKLAFFEKIRVQPIRKKKYSSTNTW